MVGSTTGSYWNLVGIFEMMHILWQRDGQARTSVGIVESPKLSIDPGGVISFHFKSKCKACCSTHLLKKFLLKMQFPQLPIFLLGLWNSWLKKVCNCGAAVTEIKSLLLSSLRENWCRFRSPREGAAHIVPHCLHRISKYYAIPQKIGE